MGLDAEIRRIVRDELQALLEEPAAEGQAPISDLARARARAALKRLGVALVALPPVREVK